MISTLERLDDWEQRAARFFASMTDRSHAWGAHDCAIYCAGAVEAMTGVDLMADFIGGYDDEASAHRLVEAVGADSIADVVDRFLDPCSVRDARRGDLLQFGDRNGFFMIRWSPRAVGAGASGVVHLPATLAARAWRVG